MPLSHYSFAESPQWLIDYIKDIGERSRQLNSRDYIPFRQISIERNEAIREQIRGLIESQKGIESDKIPFSITGNSNPLNINQNVLRNIIDNEQFARRIYESTTGFHNISREELDDLRERATTQLESYLETSRPGIESHLSRIDSEKAGIENRLREIDTEKSEIESNISNIDPQTSDIQSHLSRIDSEKAGIENRLREIDTERAGIESRLTDVDREIDAEEQQLETLSPQQRSEILRWAQRAEQAQAPQAQQLPPLPRWEQLAAQAHQLEQPEQPSELEQRRASRRNPLQEQLANLPQRRPLEEQLARLAEQRSPLQEQLANLPQRGPLQERLAGLAEQRSPLQEQFDRLIGQRSPLEEQLARLPEEEQPEFNEEQVINRASLEKEINKLREQYSHIAPMNEFHERAINMLLRSFNDDTLKLALDELMESKKHDELKAVEPLVKASLEDPSDEYMNKYVNDYTTDIRKALQDESEEEFLEKIAPKINMSFSQMGAFHSGARNKALKEAASSHRLKLQRELAHLSGNARDKAMEHHELKKRREQSAAHLLGHTTKSERDAAKNQAELLRQHAVTKHGISQLDVSALGQIARAKQEQEQNKIDVERQEYERELSHRQEQLARESALINGLPSPGSHTISGNISPRTQPPHLFNLGAGTLAALTSGIGQQQPIQRKKGGSVRKKYSNGGSIGSDEVGNGIRNIIHEQNQSNKSRLKEASNHNPVQSWLRHVGREMLSNPHEDPLLNLGRGTSATMDHGDVMRERAANLYDKIQNTKLNQYKVLAEYENMQQRNSLDKEKLLETKRAHDLMHQISNSRLEVKPSNFKKTSTEKKLEDKALENIIENYEMKNDLNLMENAIENSTLGTGPWIGVGKSFLGIDNDIDVLGNHIVTKANKLYGRGAGSNLQLKTLQGGKPGQNLSEKANETIIKKYGQESDRRINKNLSYLLKSGWTPEEISTATGIKMPYSGVTEKPKINNEGKSSKTNIVKMTDPEGNPLEVPEHDINQALDLGAVLVQ